MIYLLVRSRLNLRRERKEAKGEVSVISGDKVLVVRGYTW